MQHSSSSESLDSRGSSGEWSLWSHSQPSEESKLTQGLLGLHKVDKILAFRKGDEGYECFVAFLEEKDSRATPKSTWHSREELLFHDPTALAHGLTQLYFNVKILRKNKERQEEIAKKAEEQNTKRKDAKQKKKKRKLGLYQPNLESRAQLYEALHSVLDPVIIPALELSSAEQGEEELALPMERKRQEELKRLKERLNNIELN